MGWFGKKKALPPIKWHIPPGRHDLIPQRATDGAMAFDLITPVDFTLGGQSMALVHTMLAVTLPVGYGMILGSRSGLAVTRFVTVEAGWIDSDYRGPLKVVLYNHGDKTHEFNAGDRIAQARIIQTNILPVVVTERPSNVEETIRGEGGFGSTGT